jgi:hypothetical protein
MSDREDGQQETGNARGLAACRKCSGIGFHYLTCPVLRLPDTADWTEGEGELP